MKRRMDDLSARKIRKLFTELEFLEPEGADAFREHPLIVEAFALGGRVWQCPMCGIKSLGPRPDGWLIVEPFTRVAACTTCRPQIAAAG